MYSEWYEPPQPLQYSEYYPPQQFYEDFKGYQPQQYQEDFEGYPPQQYQEDFEWYAPPPYQQDFEGYPLPHDQQDPDWYHPPQASQPPLSTMDIANMLQQLLNAQNACLQALKIHVDPSTTVDYSHHTLNHELGSTHECFTLAENVDVNADSNILDEEDCLIEDEAKDHPVTEDSDVQVGGDDSITNEGDEETSLTPATTPTAKLDESPQLVKTQVTPTPKPRLTQSSQLEVIQVMPYNSKESTPPRDVNKYSTSPARKASDYQKKAPMHEEVIDGESLEYLFACEETADPLPENSCKLPNLDLRPNMILQPIRYVNGVEEIMDKPRVEKEETDHLSGMMPEDLVQINNSISEEPLILSLIAPLDLLPIELNIKSVKKCSHLGEKLAGAFTPCYENMTYYLVVENMANKLDQHMKKQFFDDANYSFWDEPNLRKRGFDDSFGRHLHSKTKRCKGILDSYVPTQKPNVYDEESKLCSPKVKMKPPLAGRSNWVSPDNGVTKEGKGPPWDKEKVKFFMDAETERTPPPLPAPPF